MVSGFVNAGRAQVGETVWIGPLYESIYIKSIVKSAHVSNTNVSSIVAGNSVGLALALSKDQKRMLRTGMIVLLYLNLNCNYSF